MESSNSVEQTSFTNYVSYQDPQTHKPRIGHYDLTNHAIIPLNFASGTPIDTLYQVIEVGETHIKPSTNDPFPASSIKILPPLTGRDILCVGKNYAEHAREFNDSGFDSSDKVAQPSHPVLFTKRWTSIIAHGETIYPHPEFTQTADYEGEIGVIIGKSGFRVTEEEAWGYVWGFTIVNDVTARERQRDHKQFYVGKSADTFCPMGPIAVPASKLDKVLRVQTRVNGDLRQDATTEDLIFSIPYLIKTMSEGQTLVPGDVLATGTPAGVGIGMKPPVYLQPGDTVSVSVTGLGTLENKIADLNSENPTVKQVESTSHLQHTNNFRCVNSSMLTQIGNKQLYYKTLGSNTASPIVFIHGLGGTHAHWTPLIYTLGLTKHHSLHLFDLEGHGLSPTSPLSTLSIESFTTDLNGIFEHANVQSGATLIAHSNGCFVAADFALAHPEKVKKMVLISPPPSPVSRETRRILYANAELVRTKGMSGVINRIFNGGIEETSSSTEGLKETSPSTASFIALVQLSLLGQDPEGFAKACTAFAEAKKRIKFEKIETPMLVVIENDQDSAIVRGLLEQNGKEDVKVIKGLGLFPSFEDSVDVADAIGDFIS